MSLDVAVLLNARARGVTPQVVSSIARQLPAENIFISTSLEEAHELTQTILSKGFRTVVTGGGDGTLVNFLNHSMEYLEKNGEENFPVIGVLKLGTGNGISAYLGAEAYHRDLQRLLGARRNGRQQMSLIEIEGAYSHFAGFGLDAAILNDYSEVKDTWLGKRLRYAASVPAVSLPKQLTIRRNYPVGHVINEGSPAYLIGDEGQPVGRAIQSGETIYRGPIQIAGVATMPYYGYGFKLYPYIGRSPGKMQLRLSWANTFETLSRLPWVWQGTYRSKTIRDYYCDKVRLVFDRETPFQIGGDGFGTRRDVTFTVSERTVDLIDFTRPEGSTLH